MNNSDMSSSDMDDPKTTASKASKAVSDGRDLEAETGGVSQDLGVVYGEMRSALLRFASRYFKKPQEIEDVVQEAFVKVIEAQHRRDIHSPKSYLFRTTRNLALTQLEKSSYKLTDTVGDLLPETDLTSTGTLEDQFESRQNFELFCRAVRQLPIKCQRVYILRRVYGFMNYLFTKGDPLNPERPDLVDQYNKLCYPDKDDWREMVITRSREVIDQTLLGIANYQLGSSRNKS